MKSLNDKVGSAYSTVKVGSFKKIYRFLVNVCAWGQLGNFICRDIDQIF